MEEKRIFNGEMLVSVKIRDKRKAHGFKYRPFKKKTFWSSEQKEGFYYEDFLSEECLTKEELENGVFNKTSFIVEDKEVYCRPKVILNFIDNSTIVKEFDTYREALNWGNIQTNKGMRVRLEL